MKKLRTDIFVAFLLATAVVVGGTGCKTADGYLRIEPAAIELTAEEHTSNLTVDASTGKWMAWLPDNDWLSFRYDENDASLLWITTIDSNESLVARTAEITVVTGDGQRAVVPVTHLAMPVSLVVVPATLEPFDAQGLTTRTLSVETGREWDFFSTERSDWLKMTRGLESEANILTVGVERSHTFDDRRDTIVVRHIHEPYYPLADSIPVIQYGAKLLIDSDLTDPETYDTNLPAEAGTYTVTVYATDPWTVAATDAASAAPPGVTLAPEGATGNMTGTELLVTVPDNNFPSAESFEFTLVFRCGGETYEYKFIQAGVPDPEQNPPVTEP